MDFQGFVDCIEKACCVMSVGKNLDGSCGEIRVVCSNKPYKEIMGPAYYDGMLYQELVPKEPKFENVVFQCAFGKQRIHAYVPTEGIHNTWTDQVLIPLKQENDQLGYCQFMFDFTREMEPERMAAVSAGTAEAVIRNSLMLIGAKDFRDGIQEALEDLRKTTDAKRCRIILLDKQKDQAFNFRETTSDPQAESVIIPYSIIKDWDDIIGLSDGILVKDERQMQELAMRAPDWVEHMRENNVESVVLFPLKGGDETIGYLYITNYDVKRTVEIKEMLQLMAFIMGSEIAGFQLKERLEWMSRMDELTGLQNRNAMRRRMKQMEHEVGQYPFGVVNMDLNGLKETNDRFGHEAGDRMIQYAAEIMKQIFEPGELYRAGGDEFLAIVTDLTQEEFETRLRQLYTISDEDPDFNIAIGYSWEDGNFEDLNSVFEHADKSMYDNKRAFYQRNPTLDRRRIKWD
jgi:diguanylate cyclase (GGDEF)-like protein